MTRKIFGGIRTAALAALLVSAAALAMTTASVRAMQILEAADHGELAAEVSAAGVSRIALAGDRIRRVIRAPGGFAVEHDPESGDLYLRPVAPAGGPGAEHDPVTLFIGTERGFTYRLTLTPAVRDSAQILIRNADAASAAMAGRGAGASDPRVAARSRIWRCESGDWASSASTWTIRCCAVSVCGASSCAVSWRRRNAVAWPSSASSSSISLRPGAARCSTVMTICPFRRRR